MAPKKSVQWRYWTVPQCEITPTCFLHRFLQLVKKTRLLQARGMGGLPVVLLLCSFHGNPAKQHTQIKAFNCIWVAGVFVFARRNTPLMWFLVPQRSQLSSRPRTLVIASISSSTLDIKTLITSRTLCHRLTHHPWSAGTGFFPNPNRVFLFLSVSCLAFYRGSWDVCHSPPATQWV